ncbi:MAG TPA: hypothetical protein VJR06_01360 [Nitrososphaerales archaeon]|nr:hypothetical protein [Nitrososphaerales archaeon]
MAKKTRRPASRRSSKSPALATKVERPAPQRGPRKYLIRWKIKLGQDELLKISRRPQVLDRGLNYVKSSLNQVEAEIYRIVPTEEVAMSARMTEGGSASASGIAIMEAVSIEKVRGLVDKVLEGLTFGGFPVARNYLEFQINELVEVGGRAET